MEPTLVWKSKIVSDTGNPNGRMHGDLGHFFQSRPSYALLVQCNKDREDCELILFTLPVVQPMDQGHHLQSKIATQVVALHTVSDNQSG